MAPNKQKSGSLLSLVVAGVGHLTATLLVFAAFGSLFLTEGVMQLVGVGMDDAQVRGVIVGDLAIVFGLSGCVWALTYIGYLLVRSGKKRATRVVLATPKGTIMTETLIIFPIFLLLTFGIAQMGVNSMAGLLSTLGVFQAARTVAVWAPEVGTDRTGTEVTEEMVKDHARVAAASVLAPVAPSSAGNIACSKSDVFRAMVKSLVAAGMAPVESPIKYSTFASAMDKETFAQRGPGKLAGAYCSTEVTYEDTKTTLSYKHKMVFPLVGLAFGGTLTPGGWETTITRNYTLIHHITPNPDLP